MQIISHRGYWIEPAEKNTARAFSRSIELGFGTETDLRDLAGSLVVSHDAPETGAMPADEMAGLFAAADPGLTLALNIKADGLQTLVADLIERHRLEDAFIFDMSVPDAVQWLKTGISVFTRHSDIETVPSFYDEAAGVWLDAFHGDWWDIDVIAGHLGAGKRVCIVSPELHRRDPAAVWAKLRHEMHRLSGDVILCTDFPERAAEYFGHED